MLYEQLKQYVRQSGLPNYRYFFSKTDFGYGIEDAFGLLRKGSEWQLLYCERGEFRVVKTFINEKVACRAFLAELETYNTEIRSTKARWPEELKAG